MSQTIQLNLTSIPELVDTSSLNNGWFYHKKQMLLKISSGALIRLRVASGTEAIFEPFQYQLPKRPLDSDLLTVNTLEATDTVPTTFVNKNYQIAVYNGNEIMLRVGNSFYSLKTGDFVEEYVNTTVYTRVTAFNLSLNYNECSGGSEGSEESPVINLGLLISVGAVESVDGEYQRFVYDGSNLIEGYPGEHSPIWYAGLLEQTRQYQYQITLKIPELLDEQQVYLQIVDAEIAGIFDLSTRNRLSFSVAHSYNFAAVRLGLARGNTTQAILSPSPASGSTVVFTLTPTTLDYVWDGGSGSLVIPAGFFANAPNVLAYSLADTDPTLIAPLSIKVTTV